MIDLKLEQNYIKETVDVLAIATGMEVIITDNEGFILGDSNLEETKDRDRRENLDILSEHSILRQSIVENRDIIYGDCKKENPACTTCVNAETCEINAIISLPITDRGQLVGGIGLYAFNEAGKAILKEKNDNFIEFVKRISDMMVSKVREREDKIALETAEEQQRLLIESLDEAIIGFDDNNRIININSKFYKIFRVSPNGIASLDDVTNVFCNSKLREFIDQCFEEKISEKAAFTVGDEEIIVLYKPVVVEDVYRGGLLYFRKGSDVYKDVKTIKDNYYSITFDDISGTSEAIVKLKKDAERFAKGPSNILLQGKSGTGKEMFARAIHNASFVCDGPFVTVNCAAIPENLLESELFGHKEGAFTGSMKGGKIGKFEQANGGTLFLDEIGDLPLHLQPKLLRAIQEKRIQQLGSNVYKPVNIRIISATNRDMNEMVLNGEFREDLYYRLNVIPLYIPELKERKEDIPALLELFLEKFNSVLDKNIVNFDRESKNILLNYDWPGNIRELQNVVEYAANTCNGKFIVKENLPHKTFAAHEKIMLEEIRPLKEMEEYYIKEALRVYGVTSAGKNQAAKSLGIGRSTFYRKLAEIEAKEKGNMENRFDVTSK